MKNQIIGEFLNQHYDVPFDHFLVIKAVHVMPK